MLVAELFAVRSAAHHVIDVYTPVMDASDDIIQRVLEVERDVDDLLDGTGNAAQVAAKLNLAESEELKLLRDLTAQVDALELSPTPDNLSGVTRDLRMLTRDFTAFLTYSHELVQAPPGDPGWRDEFYRQRDSVRRQADAIAAALHEARNIVAARMEAETLRTLVIVSVGFVLVVLLAIAAAPVTARRVARPIEALATAAERVRDGVLDVRVQPDGSRETVRLGQAFNDMTEGLRQKERIKETFGRYLDPRVVQRLLAHGDELQPQVTRMTIGYVNMAGFIRRAEALPPDRLIAMLNAFLDAVARPVTARGGVIDKTIGDTLMFVFGPPFSAPDSQAALATETALDQLNAIAALARDMPDFAGGGVRIGIATGPVLLGPMGAETSRAYTVIGDAANVAARIEWANRIYGTRQLIDGETRRELPRTMLCRHVDTARLPNKSAATELHEVLGPMSEISSTQREFVQAYEKALAAWRSGDWPQARVAFEACAALDPSDVPTAVFLERLDLFAMAPPEGDWQGVWTLTDRP